LAPASTQQGGTVQEWGVELDQLNSRPNATTAAYTKFLLRLAEGPQVGDRRPTSARKDTTLHFAWLS